MTGTSVIEVKRALVAGIAAALPDVKVAYSWPGRTADRECIYMGDAEFTQKPLTFRRRGQPLTRDELVTVDVVVIVVLPGGTQEDVEARAVELGEQLEDLLAVDPHLVGLAALVTGGDLISGFNDDEVSAILTYQVQVRSKLD